MRALLDLTLHDGVARVVGVPLSELLGATFAPRVPSNQCLFWSDDEALLRRAQRYLERGFTDLKLRIGIGEFAHDLARIDMLRDLGGDRISIAVDANGAWTFGDARDRLAALGDRGVTYVEQPIAAGDWQRLGALAADSTVPLMVDEGFRSIDDVAKLELVTGGSVATWELALITHSDDRRTLQGRNQCPP